MNAKATTYLISDTHFGHQGIIELASRPFKNVKDMDDSLLANWNAVVRPIDTVIHLGDFAYRADANRVWKIFQQLNGIKHLIPGNHDGPETRDLPWASVREIAFLSLESTRLVLCHYAMRTWPGIRKGALQLYGHSHGRLPGNSQSMDIGVDVLGFAPVRLSAIKAHLAKLPQLVDPEGGDDLENDGVTP
ncbi:metallophosphoesterase [Bradyrhizobium diazoefficiens]|uniref:metallophosphoesterase n=1 Tax=Bradyrhizobium diazoefficiens TaxID=1355477 RepID=UPI0004AE214B|nr:metallophosphoesterase [Bradyrhizobium diazoefficiens]